MNLEFDATFDLDDVISKIFCTTIIQAIVDGTITNKPTEEQAIKVLDKLITCFYYAGGAEYIHAMLFDSRVKLKDVSISLACNKVREERLAKIALITLTRQYFRAIDDSRMA